MSREFGGRNQSFVSDEDDSEVSSSKKSSEGVVVLAVARGIYRFRYFFVTGWLVAMVLMAPCAWMLIQRASPMTKRAPPGTESTQAMEVFEKHFKDLAVIRREMVVFKCRTACHTADTDLTRGFVQQVVSLVERFGYEHPGCIIQVNSYYTFSEHHQPIKNPMISNDHQSILLLWLWRVPENFTYTANDFIGEVQALIDEINEFQNLDGVKLDATGLVTLDRALVETLIEEVPVHEVTTIWAPFLILAFALRSPRMLLLALIPMPIEILISFGIMYFVSLKTTVLFYAVMMMLMLCTSLSFDYALFTLTRYAEERGNGADVESALVTVISQSGRVVVVSGCVLMISWAACLGLPTPFDGFCIAANSMILLCVCVQLTFVPSLLAILPFLGPPAADPRSLGSKVHSQSPSRMPLKEDQEEQEHGDDAIEPEHSEDPMAKAAPHMHGLWFCIGGWLTAFPLNIIVPLGVYALMMPLTLRMGKNFDLYSFRFEMGHSYELGIPRHRREWDTALRIQKDFPSSVGILMPMLIMATKEDMGRRPFPVNGSLLPPSNAAPARSANYSLSQAANRTLYARERELSKTPLDVRDEEFFDANCRMVNKLIDATKGKPHALDADSFVGATFHGKDPDTGGVKCIEYWEIHMVLSSYWSRKVFLSHTSQNLQNLWDQLVSKDRDAMLTFVFPRLDPFSPEAFSLTSDVRAVLRNETLAAQLPNAKIPGLEFVMFSPGSIIMDLIDVTSHMLPMSFFGCVIVCFTLIALWFGAVFISVKLLLTVVVPITWTYGAALYVYEDGKLDFLQYPGLLPVGDAGIDWTVPIFSLTFMMGLALDYEIFLFERVREFREEGFGERESIQLGLSATGGTISSAGLIMALTFFAELLGSVPITNQLGFVLVFSIVVDTFVVRSILVPAMLSLLPCLNYWPSRMPEIKHTWLTGVGGSRPAASNRKMWQQEEDEDSSTE
mmetsp:Transcript_110564/g.219851  ORF Transcript_110564/g.219851 Transcript_110564/m.219851 type:complete len:957 (+) Transcript_110564:121-2991(+)